MSEEKTTTDKIDPKVAKLLAMAQTAAERKAELRKEAPDVTANLTHSNPLDEMCEYVFKKAQEEEKIPKDGIYPFLADNARVELHASQGKVPIVLDGQLQGQSGVTFMYGFTAEADRKEQIKRRRSKLRYMTPEEADRREEEDKVNRKVLETRAKALREKNRKKSRPVEIPKG
jgi:hypothetical protein